MVLFVRKVGSRYKVNASRDFRLQINDIKLDRVENVPYLDCTIIDRYRQWDVSMPWHQSHLKNWGSLII